MTTSRTLAVPGARLYHEVRGAGPLLLVTGAPVAAQGFAPLADALASDYTPTGFGSPYGCGCGSSCPPTSASGGEGGVVLPLSMHRTST